MGGVAGRRGWGGGLEVVVIAEGGAVGAAGWGCRGGGAGGCRGAGYGV